MATTTSLTETRKHSSKTSYTVIIVLLAAIIEWLLRKPPAKVVEGESFVLGMETYVYGFPLVVSDLTRQVMTATPTAQEYSAPIN